MTVEEMLGRMSSRELAEWMAYFQYEPFGTEIEDFRSGIVAAAVVNSNSGKGSKVYGPEEFAPSYRKAILNPVTHALDGLLGRDFGTTEKKAPTENRTM
jgi:hypothetical protein